MCFRGVFVIGLIVPSNAPVFVGGEAANGVAASPFVQGWSTSNHRAAFETNIVRLLSCRKPESPRFGSRIQCCIARFHHFRGKHGLVYWLPNPIRIGSPESSPKDLQKSHEVGSSHRGANFLLALYFPRLHEFRRGTTRWYDPHGLLLVQPLTLQTVFSYLVSASVTFGGITWSRSLFGSKTVSVTELVAVCIFYTHIRFMKGTHSIQRVKHDVHTRCQVSRSKGSHEITSPTRPNSNPGLPGSDSSQLVLLCFSRVSIRSSMGIIKSSKEVTL